MKLGDKIRYLREVEGALRGMGRELTQQEVVGAIKKEMRQTISQSYLSQIESGARPHLTNNRRVLLVRCGRAPLSIWERYDWLIVWRISFLIAPTTSCCVSSRPIPRSAPSTSRRYRILSPSFIIAIRDYHIAICNESQ